MPQIPKPHVRDAFLRAAAEAFAVQGFAATTMGDVAERAGSSVGNLYKYFANKQELFAAAVPSELAQQLKQRTRARIEALGTARDVRELPSASPYHQLARDLLDFSLARRHAVVVLLARAEGTPLEPFAQGFVTELVAAALAYARGAYPAVRPSPQLCFVLQRAYQAFVGSLAAALLEFPDDDEARVVIDRLTAHHQGGLKSLFEAEGGGPHAGSSHFPSSPVVGAAPIPGAGDAGAARPHPRPASGGPAPGDRARRRRGRR